MDGACSGDAVAGLLITVINVTAAWLSASPSKGSVSKLTYTLLNVGDGLVSQIPALIVSTAAGMLVTKGGTSMTEKAVFVNLADIRKHLLSAPFSSSSCLCYRAFRHLSSRCLQRLSAASLS